MTKEKTVRAIVEAEYQKWLKGPQHDGWLIIAENVLKAERARVRALVRRLSAEASKTYYPGDVLTGYDMACDDLLTALKGKP